VRIVIPYVLLLALVAHIGAHVAIVVELARKKQWTRAALALFVSPLAPYFGWREGLKRRVFVWAGALLVYAVTVAIA
jgi:hypothetical protein